MGIIVAKLFATFPKKTPPRFHDFTTPVSVPTRARRLALKTPGAPLAAGPIDMVCKEDFDFAEGEGDYIDFASVVREKGDVLSPYAVDDANREMYFIEVDKGVDLSKTGKGTPFFYQAQRQYAICVYVVPYAVVEEVGSKLEEDLESVMMLYSTGRCGSTLFSKVLDSTSNCQSLSEPDIYTQMVVVVGYGAGGRDEEAGRVCRAYTQLLAHCQRRMRPSAPRVCIKFRSMVTEIAPLLMKAMPEVKHVFLYRNCVDVVDSFCCGLISNVMGRALPFLRWLGVDWELMKYQGPFVGIGHFFNHLTDDPRFPESAAQPLGIVGMMTLMWLSVLDMARSVQLDAAAGKGGRGFDAVFRYEDLVAYRGETTRMVLEACGMTDDAVAGGDRESVSKAFDEDAHKDSTLASQRRTAAGEVSPPQYVTDREQVLLKALLARHEEISTGYYIVPGTLKPQGGVGSGGMEEDNTDDHEKKKNK